MTFNYDKEAAINLVKNIRELDCLYDAILVAGLDGRKFPVHRIMMAASSRFFNVLLGPNFKEAHQNEVVLNEIDGSTLKLIIDYCYCCKLNINDENVNVVMAAASRMEFVQLEQECSNFWLTKLNVTNCLKTLEIADTYHLQSLWKDSMYVVCNNFGRIPTVDFMEIDERNFKSILREDLIHASENVVASRFVQWIQHDEPNRSKYVATIAKYIRLEHISQEFMHNVIDPFYKNYGCLGFVIAEYRKRSRSNKKVSLNRISGMDKLHFIEMCHDDDVNAKDTIAIHEFDEESRTLRKLFEIQFQGNDDIENVVFSKGKLFVIMNDMKEWYSVDLVTKEVEHLPKLPFKSSTLPVVVGQYIYVFHEKFFLNVAETETFARFDTEQKVWEVRKSLPPQFHDISAVELNGLIYVVGELPAADYYTSNFWCYNPNEDCWTEKPRINTIIKGGKHLLKAKNLICMLNYNFDTLMIYDAALNQWNTVNDSKKYFCIEQKIYQTTSYKGKTYGIVVMGGKFFCVELEVTAKTCSVNYIFNPSFKWFDVGVFVYKSLSNNV